MTVSELLYNLSLVSYSDSFQDQGNVPNLRNQHLLRNFVPFLLSKQFFSKLQSE
jgi:hypothetical protein